MLDPALLTAISAVFGTAATTLLQKLAEKRLEKVADKALDRLSEAGKKDELVAATEKTYAVWVKAMADQLAAAGLDEEEVRTHADSFERFLDDDAVGEALAQAVLQLEDGDAPEVGLFRAAWKRLEGTALPDGFRWDGAIKAYGKLLEKEKFKVPTLREIASAEMTAQVLGEIRELRRQAGVRPETDEVRYAERMKTKYRALDLASLAPPTGEEGGGLVLLRDAFTPQDVRENPPAVELPRDVLRRLDGVKGEDIEEKPGRQRDREEELLRERMESMRASYAQRPREKVLEILGRQDARRLVLLGYPGSGKSTLARYLLLTILEPPTGEAPAWLAPFAGHLPILIELREYIARRAEQVCESFLEFLNHLGKSQGYFVDQDGLDRRLQKHPSLVLFDGLDEIFDPAERERVAQEIAGFASTCPLARIAVTSRPAGYKEAVLKGADFLHYALEDLDDRQVEAFVTGWFSLVFPDRPAEAQAHRERIARACKSRSVRLLAGNPMLLTIMALLARHQELPRERAEFYRQAAEALCHHWDVNRHLDEVGLAAEYVGLDDKKEMLRRIAFRMQSAAKGLAGNFILGDELEEELGAYFRERYQEVPGRARKIAQEIIRHLRERNHILCLYGPGLYGFVHRTFLEYFCATEYARRFEKEPGYSIERLIEEAYAPHWEDDAWQEVLRLICGMVGEAYAGKVIEFLSGAAYPDWEEQVEHRPPRNLVLGVRCLCEVRNRNTIEPACLKLLGAVAGVLEINRRIWKIQRIQSMVNDDLLEAVREVAPQWPGKEWFRSRFTQCFSSLGAEGFHSQYANLACFLFPGDERLFQELLAEFSKAAWRVRLGILDVLTMSWQQTPAVLHLLKYSATQDPDEDVRSKALSRLGRGWPQDPMVRQVIFCSATQDSNAGVRSTALSQLGRSWPQDPAVRQLLERSATQDPGAGVRHTALLQLSRYWPQAPGVSQILQQTAGQDQHPAVRRMALEELSRGWPQDLVVRQLLKRTADQDPDENVRSTALVELVESLGLEPWARTIVSRSLDATAPFWDPLQPLPYEHLQNAARRLRCTLGELEAAVAKWSEALGWNLLEGLRESKPPELGTDCRRHRGAVPEA